MTVLEMELKNIVDKLETISTSCYSEEADPVFISERLDFVIDDVNKLIEFVKKIEKI